MREGNDLIKATKPFAQENRTTSWLHLLSTTVLVLAAIFGAAYPFHLGIRITCSILTSLLLVRMFTIYHDFLHHSILHGSKVANALFTVYGYYTLNPPSIWKRSHDYHHKHNSKLHTSSIGSFPILTVEKYLSLPKRDRNIYLFIRHPLTVAAGYIFAFTWGMCLRSLIKSPSKHWDSGVALGMHFSIGLALWLLLGFDVYLWAFLVPALISSAIGSYLFYAQHNFPGATFTDQQGWSYIGAALHSSSYMEMSPVMEFFTGNIGYHHIHHTNPRIPFYRLPEVYRAFPEFQHAKKTSLLPWDIFRCFQVKVWAPKLNRMINKKEIRNYPQLLAQANTN